MEKPDERKKDEDYETEEKLFAHALMGELRKRHFCPRKERLGLCRVRKTTKAMPESGTL